MVPGGREPSEPEEVTLRLLLLTCLLIKLSKYNDTFCRLWQNGFSVNDGELREYTDPQNSAFLSSIRRGEIPHELRQGTNEVSYLICSNCFIQNL